MLQQQAILLSTDSAKQSFQTSPSRMSMSNVFPTMKTTNTTMKAAKQTAQMPFSSAILPIISASTTSLLPTTPFPRWQLTTLKTSPVKSRPFDPADSTVKQPDFPVFICTRNVKYNQTGAYYFNLKTEHYPKRHHGVALS